MRSLLIVLAAVGALPLFAMAADNAPVDQARLTVGMPAYVWHPNDRSGGRDWNQGWFNNEGVLVDATWPVRKLGEDTMFRAGVTAGAFDNSEFHTSVFAGGVAEVETFATKRLAFSLGTYAGGITGYGGVNPALAPYVGTSYAVTDRVEAGVRGFWLPARTIGGSDLADSDAYIAAITIGTRF